MINAEIYKKGSPEKAIAMFLECWAGRKWSEMTKWVQLSWLDIYPEPEETLKTMFCFKIEDVSLIEARFLNNVTFSALMIIKYQIARNIYKTKKVDAKVIKEIEPMIPSPNGKWGVNPTSVMVQ